MDPVQGVDPARAKAKRKRKANTDETPAFIAFYTAFPRHTGRDAAWKAWREKGLDAEAAKVMSALEWQNDQVFSHTPWDKIPYPASWINAGRWKDEPPAAAVMPRMAMQTSMVGESWLSKHGGAR